ncbi:MAG: hypothetical protein KDJ65_06465 [Anaerolineae bacterium]|nr:hypothetical protein [Anaerolineae bacterium]
MGNSFWRTKAEPSTRKTIHWPSPAQLITQLGIAVAITLIWGALWWGFVQFAADKPDQSAALPQNEAVQVDGEPSPTPLPPTDTPVATSTPQPTAAAADPVGETAGATDQPAEQAPPIDTATPSPAPTETPLPATDTPVPASVENTTEQVSFAADVFPIIENRCVKCHGGEETEEGLSMTSHAEIMQGSWNGSILEPGNADNSFMVEQIISGEMPKNEPRLLPREIRIITEWINVGAPDN